jgi:hypothetical protein
MAFLDNSGDIILDAVLTEVGRQRLAEATRNGGTAARITHFALGDDEINYSQYELNSPSGSNYADLQILQTPILEAFTSNNANINYGLLKIRNTELLYLPSLVVNEKEGGNFIPLQKYNGVYMLAVNTKTYNTLTAADNTNVERYQVGNAFPDATGPFVYVEGGLNTDELSKTATNRSTYLPSNVSNTSYTVGLDSRLARAYTCTTGMFANDVQSGADNRKSFTVSSNSPLSNLSISTGLSNYNFYTSKGVKNAVYVPNMNGPASDLSAIAGPGDTVTCFKPSVKASLATDGTAGGTRDILYSQIGFVRLAGNLPGLNFAGSAASAFFDVIDTIAYVYGDSTGASLSVPIRLMRQVS